MTTTSTSVEHTKLRPWVQTSAAASRAAAAAAIVATAARVASIFLWPPDSDAGHAKMLATAAAHPRAWTAATAAEVVAWIAAGCAVLAGTALVTGRGRWPARIGGWWYGASLIMLGLVGGVMNSVTGVLAQQPNRPAMIGVQDHLHSSVLDTFVTVVLIGELMLVVFGFGLVRAQLVGWWFLAVSVLSVAAYVATADSSNHLVVLAGFAPLAVTWLTLARLLAVTPAGTPRTAVRGSAGAPALPA